MGTTDHGTQEITHEYFEDATASEFNKRNLDLKPMGIYSGGHLTRVTNSEVILTPFTVEIQDGTMQISSKSSVNATLKAATLDSGTISSATPYLVLRWAYTAAQNNYVEVHALASVAAAAAYDIIIGKCVFSGPDLSAVFDYSDRTLLNVQDVFLRVEVTEATEVKVWVRGGRIQTSSQTVVIAEQKLAFAVPGSNSRIDLVYVDTDGTLAIQQGVVAPSPSTPDYGGKLVLAEVLLVNGDGNIAASRITDVRSFISGSISPIDSVFDSWTDKDSVNNTLVPASTYQVGSDGIVIAHSSNNGQKITIETPAATTRITTPANIFYGDSTWRGAPMTCPVKKNSTFKVLGTGATIWWIPFGSGTCVKQ